MLILTRRTDEIIRIVAPDGDEIDVKYMGNNSEKQARLGIDAPEDYHILRISRDGDIETGVRKT